MVPFLVVAVLPLAGDSAGVAGAGNYRIRFDPL